MPDSDNDDLSGLQRRILFTNDKQQKKQLQQRMYQKSLQAAKEEFGPAGVEQQQQLWQAAANGLQEGYRKGAMGGISANAQRLDYDEWEDRDDLTVTEARMAKTASRTSSTLASTATSRQRGWSASTKSAPTRSIPSGR